MTRWKTSSSLRISVGLRIGAVSDCSFDGFRRTRGIGEKSFKPKLMKDCQQEPDPESHGSAREYSQRNHKEHAGAEAKIAKVGGEIRGKKIHENFKGGRAAKYPVGLLKEAHKRL